jgi:UDP-N-acetylmuramate: L-alanyl-gamma-D-glutamyl-meso-diaminopimelate ligase
MTIVKSSADPGEHLLEKFVLDPALNAIPERVASVHMTAVCGTAMGALAAVLQEKGIAVTGSDAGIYPPMSTFLTGRGITITEGFSAENLAYHPDLVVVGNAVRRDNPEVSAIAEKRLAYCSMPQAVNRFLVENRQVVVIAGTHGKTTTSAMVAWLLSCAGYDPAFLIGGILGNFNANYHVGGGGYAVLEGDEYDTAFFDKGAKFLHYTPDIAVLTGVEFDHADIFTDLGHVKSVFDTFLLRIGKSGRLIAYDDDQNVKDLLAGKACKIEVYGENPDSYWHTGKNWVQFPYSCFEVMQNGRLFGSFKMKLIGAHNRMNALSAVAVAAGLGIPADVIAEGLETFAGVKRRQEIRGVKNGVMVIDDFAHHPTAVKKTVEAVKAFYPAARLFAVFEPRTNTSMRSVFQKVYPECFNGADTVCIRKPPLLGKIPEGQRFSSRQLVSDLKDKNIDAHYFSDTDHIIAYTASRAREGDIVLIMSNGGFDNIHERLLEAL